MAAQNNKKTSGGNRQASKKRNSSGTRNTENKNKKENQGPDLLTILVVLIAVVLVVVLVSKYKKENEGTGDANPTGSVSATGTSVPDEVTQPPVTKKPEPTQEVNPSPTLQATPEAPSATEAPALSMEEAKDIVDKIIQLENYSIELLDDHLMIDGAEYYSFCINDEKGVSMEPLLIVEKKEGTLLCYDMSGVVAPIAKFPLDKVETGNEGTKTLTGDEAMTLISGYSGERLGLAKDTEHYEMTLDDWTTIADGTECYGVNFFENVNGKQRFRGTFYVALDGSAVYGKDEITGDFIKR